MFSNFIKGLFIGSGAILPGISSGVFCVIFGIYEKLLNSVMHFFKSPKENLKFLLPIALGGLLGIIIIGKLLLYVYSKFYIPTCFAFIGLILGSIPIIIKQTNSTKFKFSYLLCLLLSFSFSIYLVALETMYSNNSFVSNDISSIYLIFSGFLMSFGIIIPGVSSSVILMLTGIYEIYLQAISNLNITILIPLVIGISIGCIFILKLIQFMFNNFRTHTYYLITGFVIGSIFVLYPGISFDITGFISVTIFLICFIISNRLETWFHL